jgi:thioredoxin 1
MEKLFYFTADWCGPCRMSSPVVEDIFTSVEGIKNLYSLERVNVDQEPELASRMGIRGVPTFVILDDQGKERARHVGAMPKAKMLEWLADVPFRMSTSVNLNNYSKLQNS